MEMEESLMGWCMILKVGKGGGGLPLTLHDSSAETERVGERGEEEGRKKRRGERSEK